MKTKAPFLRTPYNYDTDEASNDTALHCTDPTLAQQHFKDECDINTLFARYLDSGEMPQIDAATYGDFTGIFNFQDAANKVLEAKETFSQLPAKLKTRFDNDPQKLINFLNDPENKDEAQFLGLVNKPKEPNEPAPTAIPPTTTQTTTPPPGAAQDTGTPTPPRKP